jgi:hypothetical protein
MVATQILSFFIFRSDAEVKVVTLMIRVILV